MRKTCQGYGKPKKGPPPSARRKRGDFVFSSEAAHKASLMRHGWYRRKMRAERPDQECWW